MKIHKLCVQIKHKEIRGPSVAKAKEHQVLKLLWKPSFQVK